MTPGNKTKTFLALSHLIHAATFTGAEGNRELESLTNLSTVTQPVEWPNSKLQDLHLCSHVPGIAGFSLCSSY